MKVTTERLEHSQVNVYVELDAAEVDEKLRQTARRISRQYNVPGYRRGHAPLAAVIRAFGRDALHEETLEDFGQELYKQAIEQIDFKAYEAGELKEVQWDPFRMTVLLPVEPEVSLGDYRAVRVPFEVTGVTDEQVAADLEQLQKQHGQWVPVNRPAAMGDQVVIDGQGSIGGEQIWSVEDEEVRLFAHASEPAPDFWEAVVGMAPGEDKSFTIAYASDDRRRDRAGREEAFHVHLHTVKELEPAPLDDDLAVMVGDYDTLEALRASVRERLEAEAQQRAEAEYADKVLDTIIGQATTIDYPPQAVDHEAELALRRMESNLESSGIKLENFLQMIRKTREGYLAELRPAAEERLKKRLVLTEVARREALKLEDEEIEAEVQHLREIAGEDEEVHKFLESERGHLSVADDLLMAKVEALLVQIGKGEAPPLPPEAQVEAGAEPKPESEPEATGEGGAEAVTAPEPKPESEPEATGAGEAEAVTAPEPEAAPEGEAKVAEPESEPQAEPQATPEDKAS